MAQEFGIHITFEEPADDVSLVTVGGELDVYGLREFKDALAMAEENAPQLIVLDLRELDFIDSSGLGAIIGVHGRTAKSGHRLVVCPSEVVSKTFEVTGLHRVLSTAPAPDSLFD